jgi:hypothetical protein
VCFQVLIAAKQGDAYFCLGDGSVMWMCVVSVEELSPAQVHLVVDQQEAAIVGPCMVSVGGSWVPCCKCMWKLTRFSGEKHWARTESRQGYILNVLSYE